MNSRAIRAVAETFIKRKYNAAALPVLIVGVILIVLFVWLVNLSLWWLLLAIPIITVVMIAFLVLLIIRWLLSRLTLELLKHQKTAVNAFVDKLERVADKVNTPVPFLLAQIVWDSLQPGTRKHRTLKSMVDDSSSLTSHYEVLQTKFDRS